MHMGVSNNQVREKGSSSTPGKLEGRELEDTGKGVAPQRRQRSFQSGAWVEGSAVGRRWARLSTNGEKDEGQVVTQMKFLMVRKQEMGSCSSILSLLGEDGDEDMCQDRGA